MHIVAIHGLGGDREGLAKGLAAALGATLYEALARLRVPGSGPVTVAVFAEEGRAAALLEKLKSSGFGASVLTDAEIELEGRASIVRRFSLGEHDLGVTSEKGDSSSIPFQEIAVILRGTAIISGVTTETTKTRSVDAGRAVLSGGLMITKTTTDVREVITEERQGFVNLYRKDGPVLVFREKALAYDSLGPAIKPSRTLNFSYLVSELRRLCPGAVYDERLLTRAGQVGLLGPSLNPEQHINVAAALLRKVLGGKV